MTLDEFHQKLTNINVWQRGEQRAPHKPLLLLLAMGRAVRGEQRLALFSEIDEALTGLLRHFGPPRRSYHPEFPFRYLTNDGLWEIPNASLIDEARRGWGKKALRDRGIIGGLPESLYRLLVADSASAREAADSILDEHFPASMHQHILEAVGLEGIASKGATGAGYRTLVSGDVNGTSAAVRWLLDYHGQPVRPPQKGVGEPRGDYVAWHTKEVFRSPPRGL